MFFSKCIFFILFLCFFRIVSGIPQSTLDVEGVTDAAREEHEGEDNNHDGDAWDKCQVGVVEENLAVILLDHGAP